MSTSRAESEQNPFEPEPVEVDSEREEGGFYRDDERDWREQHPSADEGTLKGRKYSSDFSAALKSIAQAEGWEPADIATALTLVDAARRADRKLPGGAAPSIVRRFACAAWLLELYYRRETLPDFATEEEARRFQASYSRAWRRRWDSLHDKQCRTHHGFFVKHDPENSSDGKPKACSYTDRLTDALNLIAQRGRKMRGRSAVEKFEAARAEVMAEFEKQFPRYAPNWTEPAPPVDDDASGDEAPEESDETYFEAVDRVAKRCIKHASGKSEDEQVEFYTQLVRRFQAQLAEIRPPGPTAAGGDIPPGSSVSYMADKKKSHAAASGEFRARASEPLCENTEENCENGPDHADKFALMGRPSDAPPEAQARALIEALVSVGVRWFKVVFISCISATGDYRLVGPGEDVPAPEIGAHIARYVRRSERQEQSVCLRPMNPELKQGEKTCSNGALIQVDDCSPEVLERLAPYAFLTVETSPGNSQAWLALPAGATEGERVTVRERLLRQLKDTGANGGAYNSIRLPGALNAKEKYRDRQGRLPRVRLVAAHPGRVVAPRLLEAAGLLAAPLPPKVVGVATYSNAHIPTEEVDYYECLGRSPKTATKDYDRSNADIVYAILMLKKGWPSHYIASRINDHSDKAKGRRDDYARKTVDAAARYLAAESPARPSARPATQREVVNL